MRSWSKSFAERVERRQRQEREAKAEADRKLWREKERARVEKMMKEQKEAFAKARDGEILAKRKTRRQQTGELKT